MSQKCPLLAEPGKVQQVGQPVQQIGKGTLVSNTSERNKFGVNAMLGGGVEGLQLLHIQHIRDRPVDDVCINSLFRLCLKDLYIISPCYCRLAGGSLFVNVERVLKWVQDMLMDIQYKVISCWYWISLTDCHIYTHPWKMMVGRRSFPFGFR